jgi:AraC-like DNA-binding protein
LGTALGLTPELSLIKQLFKAAEYGIAFNGETKRLAAEKLKQLGKLNSLEQLLQLISIFQLLAASTETEILNRNLNSGDFILKDKVRMGAIYEHIEANFHKKLNTPMVAKLVNLTQPAFCRYFRRQTNMKFSDFLNQYRIERAKNLLMQNHTISETCYAIGFESLSYFSYVFKKGTGVTPSDFKNKWQNKMI